MATTKYTAPKTVDELASMLENSAYTPKSDAELRTAAENMYRNQRDQAILSAQQTRDASVSALNSQLDALGTSYARQREQQQQATVQSRANADRQSLSRGMQRSSYNNATLANIDLAGNKALAQIDQNQTDDTNSIKAQISQLEQQLQQNLASANSTYENNVLAKLQELQDAEYSRRLAAEDTANDIRFKLYQYQQAAGGGTSSGGGRSGSKPAAGTGTDAKATGTDDGLDKDLQTNPAWLGALMGVQAPTQKTSTFTRGIPDRRNVYPNAYKQKNKKTIQETRIQ